MQIQQFSTSDGRTVLVQLTPVEALMLIQSLTQQMLEASPNVGRSSFIQRSDSDPVPTVVTVAVMPAG